MQERSHSLKLKFMKYIHSIKLILFKEMFKHKTAVKDLLI